MKLKPYNYAFLLICWVLMCSVSASAQEGRSPLDMDPAIREVPRNEPDPVLSTESEGRTSKTTIPTTSAKETTRDTTQVRIVPKANKTSEKEEKEEDPLSFNFLYYIIGKFKLSDIIE